MACGKIGYLSSIHMFIYSVVKVGWNRVSRPNRIIDMPSWVPYLLSLLNLLTLQGKGHSAAGWGIGGSVMAADCGVQSPFMQVMGCRYLRCAT